MKDFTSQREARVAFFIIIVRKRGKVFDVLKGGIGSERGRGREREQGGERGGEMGE